MSLQEKVKNLAYELYEKNGRREGRDLLDWLAAEQIIRFRQMLLSGVSDDGVGLLEYKPVSDPALDPVPRSKSQKRFRRSGGERMEAGERVS